MEENSSGLLASPEVTGEEGGAHRETTPESGIILLNVDYLNVDYNNLDYSLKCVSIINSTR